MGSSCNKYRSTVSSFEPCVDGNKNCGIAEPSFQTIDGKDTSNEIPSDNNKIGNDLGVTDKNGKDHEKDGETPEVVANAGTDGSDARADEGGVDVTNTSLEAGVKSQDAAPGDAPLDITTNCSDTANSDQQTVATDATQVESDDLLNPTELPDNTSDQPRVDNDADLDSGMEYDEDDEFPTDSHQKKSGDNHAHHGIRASDVSFFTLSPYTLCVAPKAYLAFIMYSRSLSGSNESMRIVSPTLTISSIISDLPLVTLFVH